MTSSKLLIIGNFKEQYYILNALMMLETHLKEQNRHDVLETIESIKSKVTSVVDLWLGPEYRKQGDEILEQLYGPQVLEIVEEVEEAAEVAKQELELEQEEEEQEEEQ